jgi:hypothetical protein
MINGKINIHMNNKLNKRGKFLYLSFVALFAITTIVIISIFCANRTTTQSNEKSPFAFTYHSNNQKSDQQSNYRQFMVFKIIYKEFF